MQTLPTGRLLSKIDLANGFWSMPLHEENKKKKTAFTHSLKQYVYNRLPQGYLNAPSVFQATMIDILKNLPVVIYIDGILSQRIMREST